MIGRRSRDEEASAVQNPLTYPASLTSKRAVGVAGPYSTIVSLGGYSEVLALSQKIAVTEEALASLGVLAAGNPGDD